MVSEQKHEMRLAVTHPSGAEEWLCPLCGRRFIAEWEPKFRRVILERGQDAIAHVGHGMGLWGLTAESTDEQKPADDSKFEDVWKKYLDTLDFDPEDDDNKSPQ